MIDGPVDSRPWLSRRSLRNLAAALALLAISGLAFYFFGWIGIAAVGLLGIVINQPDGLAIPGYDYSANAVRMTARQISEIRRPEEKRPADKDAASPRRKAVAINLLWLAMIVFGLAMAILYQI